MSNALEEYLKQFRSGLKGLPAEQRDAEVEETRQHLESLIQLRVENGEPKEIAVANAIQQFGSAHTIARATRKIWQREHRDARRENLLRRVHLLHVLVLAHSLIIQLLTFIFWRLDDYVRPSISDYYPSWLPFRPDKVASFLLELPATFRVWGATPFYSWTISLFFLVFALLSLWAYKEMRTTFFGVFAVLIGSIIFIQATTWGINFGFYPFGGFAMDQCLSDVWKIILFLISIWALCVSLARHKSLLTSTSHRKSA